MLTANRLQPDLCCSPHPQEQDCNLAGTSSEAVLVSWQPPLRDHGSALTANTVEYCSHHRLRTAQHWHSAGSAAPTVTQHEVHIAPSHFGLCDAAITLCLAFKSRGLDVSTFMY